jgi:hypothetical protein
MSEFDAKKLYESIPVGCREEEAVAAAGFPPGDHSRYYVVEIGGHRDREEGRADEWLPGVRHLTWNFDRGMVWVVVSDSGRVVAKWYKRNLGYRTRPRESWAERVFNSVGLRNPFE